MDLSDLTPAQREAVTTTEGPLLVLAGAGSGKTRVITRRVAHLIERGTPPQAVLAITFTNKAAGEMRRRIERLSGGARVEASTFHAFCARLLRRFAPAIDRRRDFTILDDSDQLAAAREALVETGTDPKLYGANKVLHAIERAKDRLESPADLEAAAETTFEKVVARAYAHYEDLLRQSNAMDFGDLLARAVEVLRLDAIRQDLARRYRYLLIDEYQDTNHAQYLVAKLLAQEHRNICATGDPNQSIYGWRGADIGNILSFERDWPEARIVKLERNFRSTRTILRAANGVIARNTERRDVELTTEDGEGPPLELRVLPNEHEEGRWVARQVEEALHAGVPRDEVAVFYRTNALSRSIEVALLERGVPYEVVGATAFYQRKEVKDVLAYLRLATNPHDDLAVARIANVPPRGVGKTTLAKVKEAATRARTTLLEAARALAQGGEVRGRGREGLSELVRTLEGIAAATADERRVEEVLRTILAATGYREYLVREFPDDQEDRLLNLEALLAGAHDFDAHQAERAASGGEAARPRRAAALDRPAPARGEVEREREREQAPPDGAGPSAAASPAAPDMPLFGGWAPPEPEVPQPPAPAGVAAAPAAPVSPPPDDPFALHLGLDEPAGQDPVGAFLEHVALASAVEAEARASREPRVALMTVHAAKGLEFDTVFLTGLEDGLFPHGRALEGGGGLEEERRLAYVAITRAKRRLVLTRASWRAWQGHSRPQTPSLFLYELPDDVFVAGGAPGDHDRAAAAAADDDARWGVEGEAPWATGLQGRRPRGRPWARPEDEDGVDPPAWDEDAPRPARAGRAQDRGGGRAVPSPVRAAPGARTGAERVQGPLGIPVQRAPAALEAPTFREGDRVLHEHFGRGVVEAVRGLAATARVRVRFRDHGTKELVVQYARMTKVEP